MKTKLILLPDYNIIVSDEDLNINDITYTTDGDSFGISVLRTDDDINSATCIDCFKLISSENPKHNLPSIDYNGFEDRFGIIDIEKLAKEAGYSMIRGGKLVYAEGFKKAQSLNNKKFSLEDMKRAFGFFAFLSISQQPYNKQEEEEYFNKFIQSIQQPKEFNVEIEMDYDNPLNIYYYPKITNNKIKIINILWNLED